MSAVCVLTPVVIGSWPVIQAAIVGAMAAMGFSARAATGEPSIARRERRVEEEIANSQVLTEHMQHGERIVAEKDSLRVEFGRDNRGACTICISGEGYTDSQLRVLARQISSKVVQQYTYHKVITELQSRQFTVSDQQVTADGTIKLYVRRTGG